MKRLKNKTILQDGRVLLTTTSAIASLNNGASIEDIDVDDDKEMELFNYYAYQHCDDAVLKHADPIDHQLRQNEWVYPQEFEELDLYELFDSLCDTDEQRARARYELQLYQDCGLEKLLRWAAWFMCVVKANNLFIGVGRGSSVSSYCLYLIGMHMVDSMKYGLDPEEFFKIHKEM